MFDKLNKYLTPITDELISSLPEEVANQFFDFIHNVPYILNLISPNRLYAKDRPRDSSGKIIVDLTNPHILENMDYFRESAIHFLKYGCFTKLKPNSNPNSDYNKWLKREIRRCHYGMLRPSDGEWITGYMYFYLNYTPIVMTKVRKGTNQGDRVEGFPEVWEGVYLAFHYLDLARNGGLYNDFKGSLNAALLARRGASKSYEIGSMTAKNFLLGENAIAYQKIRTVIAAHKTEYLLKDGTLNKFEDIIDFTAIHTLFPRLRLISDKLGMTWVLGYKDKTLNIAKGVKNTVLGVALETDASKLRGKRSNIYVDEFGSLPSLLEAYLVWLPSLFEGDTLFGLLFLVGTAGDKDSDFEGALEIMYNPDGYKMYGIPNVYDKVGSNKKKFIYFFPGYINRKGCYDENGNSDVIKALILILLNRYQIKYNTTKDLSLLRVIAEIPVTPAEAIIKVTNNYFPVTSLNNRLELLSIDTTEFNSVYTGWLVFNLDNEVVFKPSTDLPIRDFPHKNNKIIGAIEIYNMPEKDNTGKIPSNRYILSCDPYENDLADTASLGSIFVLDLFTDNIAAEYTGRPEYADDFYEIARKLCLFYNGKMNYENNKKGMFSYFSKTHSLHLLTDNLEFLRDKLIVKVVGFGNTSKGTIATKAVNDYARRLIRDWLISPVLTITEENGDLIELIVPRLSFIKSRALLLELVAWNSLGNFDRVSSLGMLMLLREDKLIKMGGTYSPDTHDCTYLGEDKFFKQYDNYKNTYIR